MNPATTKKADQLKGAEIQLIHVGLAKLGLDDADKAEIYRNFGGGKASSKDMTWQERKRVLDHLRSRGFNPTTPRAAGKSSGSPSRRLDTTPDASKVRALWLALADLGAVRDRSEAALQSYVHRITGIDDIHWCSSADLRKLIESLKRWVQRVCRELAPDLLRQVEGQWSKPEEGLAILRASVSALTNKQLPADAAQDLIATLRRLISNEGTGRD